MMKSAGRVSHQYAMAFATFCWTTPPVPQSPIANALKPFQNGKVKEGVRIIKSIFVFLPGSKVKSGSIQDQKAIHFDLVTRIAKDIKAM